MRLVLRFVTIAVLLVTVFTLLSACSGDVGEGISAGKTGPGAVGVRCQGPADCQSGKCVRVDDAEGVCSQDCVDDSGCPRFDNWRCVDASAGTRVCACRPVAPDQCSEGVDNDCNGKLDDCNDCGGTLVPKNDRRNCGACGIECRNDQSCTNGACTCFRTGTTNCGGACVDTKSDYRNCGGCGKACPAEQTCVDGECKCSSTADPDACPGAGCVNLKTDPLHCGTCDTLCPASQKCQNGKCSCEASAPDFCPGAGCKNTKSDPSHCGACGHACPSGATCENGQCTCPANKAAVCSDSCVNLSNDPQNCGACGTTCSSGQYCSGGKCTCYSSGTTNCSGQCVLTSSDPNNCGACGKKCRVGESCIGGSCNCASGVICGDVCRSSSDAANCGACGKTCGAGQYCSSGTCICSTYGLTACGTSCVNTSSDPANCGTCGHACRLGEICRFGTCACPQGQTYCAEAGKCVDLRNDPTHCGTCTNVCAPTQQCLGGSCSCGVYGQAYCASADSCIDIMSNDQSCGACDRACPAQTHCSSGTCVCSTTGLTLCGTTCVDLQKDKGHCGSCAVACDGLLTCNSGKCRCPTPVLATEVRVTTTAAIKPAVAWNGTHFGVAYLDTSKRTGSYGGNVLFTLLNADGTRALAQDIALTSFAGTGSNPTVATPPDVVWNGSEWGVVWTQAWQRTPNSFLYTDAMFMRLAADGAPLGPAVDITAATSNGHDVRGPVRIAYSAAGGGYAIAAFAPPRGIDFQRIGMTGATPDPINHVDLYTDYFSTRLGFAAAPDGHWGVLSRYYNSLTFTEFNADGSRTKNPVVVETSALDVDPDLTHDGTSWLGAWTASRWVGNLSRNVIVAARGVALGSLHEVVSQSDLNMGAARVSMSAGTAVFVWSQRETSTSFKLRFARVRLPAGTAAPVAITDSSPLLETPTEGPDATAFAVGTAGSNAFITVWGDTRWGGSQLYAVSTDLQNCE